MLIIVYFQLESLYISFIIHSPGSLLSPPQLSQKHSCPPLTCDPRDYTAYTSDVFSVISPTQIT